ncbi:MAG: methylmalonyl-CoA epimerase [Chloroflexi bacterium]|nr:methylmalonyl-CoA epimerase [Chloroflexota bacterium]
MTDIKLNHLAIVVDDMEAALRFWRESLGLAQAGAIESVPAEDVDIAFLTLGEAHIEIVQPTSDDSGVAKYLAKRGPGMHHLCLEVADLDVKLEALSARGYELINETPRERDGRRYAFIHPRSAGGVLLELYETAQADSRADGK